MTGITRKQLLTNFADRLAEHEEVLKKHQPNCGLCVYCGRLWHCPAWQESSEATRYYQAKLQEILEEEEAPKAKAK